MSCELDDLLWRAWQKLAPTILANPLELRRRLDRRARAYDHVPRPLCLAIKASDRRLVAAAPTYAIIKGRECEHDLLLDSGTIKDLCRPVELYWGQHFRKLAAQLGSRKDVPNTLEHRGIILGRRVRGLGGRGGQPDPLIDSPVPAMAGPEAREWEQYGIAKVLDPGAWGYTAPDRLLLPYWKQLSLGLPEWFTQAVRRRPVHRVRRGRLHLHWVWVCPECQREAGTMYIPLGAPDFVRMHGIELPCGDEHETPEPRLCCACHRCHGLYRLARTPKAMAMSWNRLVIHLSGGLLFGHEVKRPASFGVLRKSQRSRPGRPSPRRDELEAYLVHTDLSLKEIARRMGLTYQSVACGAAGIRKRRRVRGGRAAYKRWWARHAPARTARVA